jgi:hypothetical protein
MRCEDCLPLVEEYFDGEVGGRTRELMRAHLSACETCAAALDALSFEQEVYARYDRGLEVGPALWARVSAEKAPEQPPFLSRLRGRLAAFTPAAVFARPAFASSLALLLVGVTAGSLWLARRPQTNAPAEVAVNTPGARVTKPSATAEVKAGGVVGAAAAPASDGPDVVTGGAGFVPAGATHEGAYEIAAAAARPQEGLRAAEREVDVETLLAESSAPKAAGGNIVVIRADEHAAAEDAPLFVNASAADAVVARPEPLLDPGQKDVARHVEQTQMLLRSIKNARPASDEAVDIAYEKKLSRRLLAENATLQLDAEVRGDKDTKQVLDQIEPFLLDIANMRDKASREDVRSIRERVTKNEIIAALQVY